MKLESEIQNSIMTRYFYYQLINVYVTVGFSGSNLWIQIINTLQKPQVNGGVFFAAILMFYECLFSGQFVVVNCIVKNVYF